MIRFLCQEANPGDESDRIWEIWKLKRLENGLITQFPSVVVLQEFLARLGVEDHQPRLTSFGSVGPVKKNSRSPKQCGRKEQE